MSSMYGGVDLSALAAAKQAKENVSSSPLVRSVGKENIEELLQQSTEVPFVLVFHSERSEGSIKLVETLTGEVTTRGGSLGLGVVDVDKDRDIASVFRVQAVPTTVAVVGGNPIPLFQGVPQDSDIVTALDNVAAAAAQMGVTGSLSAGEEAPKPKPLPPHIAEARAAFDEGNLEEAENEYAAALKENPGEQMAKSGLAQVQLLRRIEHVDPIAVLEKAQQGGLEDHLLASDVEVASGHPENAFARLLAMINQTTGDDRERARLHLLDLFTVVGSKNPAVNQARRALANALM